MVEGQEKDQDKKDFECWRGVESSVYAHSMHNGAGCRI